MRITKRGVMWTVLIPALLAIGVAVILFILYLAVTGKLGNAWEWMQNVFRFRMG